MPSRLAPCCCAAAVLLLLLLLRELTQGAGWCGCRGCRPGRTPLLRELTQGCWLVRLPRLQARADVEYYRKRITLDILHDSATAPT